MHPKVMKTVDRFRKMIRRVEASEPKVIYFEKLYEKHGFESDVWIDSWGDISVTTKFKKRSDLDPLLIETAVRFQKEEIVPEMRNDVFRAYVDGIKLSFHPEAGSDCELVQVGEEYVTGYTRPIYKMKCEHEHEEAERRVEIAE